MRAESIENESDTYSEKAASVCARKTHANDRRLSHLAYEARKLAEMNREIGPWRDESN